MFKIGSQLFTAEGPTFVKKVIELDEKVFLDLKFHDIPSVVAKAAAGATRLRVSMLTLHTLGGADMLVQAKEAVTMAANDLGRERPLLIGVTVLTSMDQEGLSECGITKDLNEMVLRLASLAASSGLDGLVASPREAALLKGTKPKKNLLVVTPGIRPAWSPAEDQHRVMTPDQALAQGADYLVVGRPILRADDPVAATERILAEMGRQCEESK